MLSGVFCVVTTYPIDIVRARVTVSPGEYKMGMTGGLADGLVKMATKEGVSSWFSGVNAVVPWGAMYYGSQFFTYDLLKKQYSSYGMKEGEKRQMTPYVAVPCGAAASVVSTTFAFPFECVRRKLQTQADPNPNLDPDPYSNPNPNPHPGLRGSSCPLRWPCRLLPQG